MSNASQVPFNPFAAQQTFLRGRLHAFIAPLHPALRSDVERALSEDGKLLSLSPTQVNSVLPLLPAGAWPLLTLFVAQHVTPGIDPARAGNVALAVECFVCALDLLDDVEDEDLTPVMRELGVARVLNVSTTLLALAQQLILAPGLQKAPPTLIRRLLQAFDDCTIDAVTGQHRDLLAEQRAARELTREECIEIAAGKAGAVMRLACLSGAICAGAKRSVCEQFAQLGTMLGIAHQLDNDAHDLYYLLHREFSPAADARNARGSVKSDLARGKKTLPVVLAALSISKLNGGDVLLNGLDAALKNLSGISDREKQKYLPLLNEGIQATWGISLLYRERARERLLEIETQWPVAAQLRLLLGFDSSPRET